MTDTATTDNGSTWRPDLPPSPDSIPRAIAIAVVLGALGPGLAYVLFDGLALVISTVALPPLAALAVLLGAAVAIPYLSFAGLGLGYLRYRGLDWGGIRSYFGIGRPGIRDVIVVVGGWVLIFVLIIAAGALVQYVGAEPAQNQNVQQAQQAPILLLLLIPVMFLVVGPTEEILYRGVIQGRLREVLGPAPAILVASAVFALAHVLALTGGLAGRATTIGLLFVPALVLGAVYEYTENLVVPIVLHAIHNSVLLALLWVTMRYAPEGASGAVLSPLLAAMPL